MPEYGQIVTFKPIPEDLDYKWLVDYIKEFDNIQYFLIQKNKLRVSLNEIDLEQAKKQAMKLKKQFEAVFQEYLQGKEVKTYYEDYEEVKSRIIKARSQIIINDTCKDFPL